MVNYKKKTFETKKTRLLKTLGCSEKFYASSFGAENRLATTRDIQGQVINMLTAPESKVTIVISMNHSSPTLEKERESPR